MGAPVHASGSPKLISDAPSHSVQAPVCGLGIITESLPRAAKRGGTGVAGPASGAELAGPHFATTGLPNATPLPATGGELLHRHTSSPAQLLGVMQLSAAERELPIQETSDAPHLPVASALGPVSGQGIWKLLQSLSGACCRRDLTTDAAVGGTAGLRARVNKLPPSSPPSQPLKLRAAAGDGVTVPGVSAELSEVHPSSDAHEPCTTS